VVGVLALLPFVREGLEDRFGALGTDLFDGREVGGVFEEEACGLPLVDRGLFDIVE